jgi:hypothetical protein
MLLVTNSSAHLSQNEAEKPTEKSTLLDAAKLHPETPHASL